MYLARFDDGDASLVMALVHLAPPELWDDERAEARFNEAIARHLRAALSLDLTGLGYRLTLDANGAVHRHLLLLADARAEESLRRYLGAIALLEAVQTDTVRVPMSREEFDREADIFPPHQLAIETGLLAGPDGIEILDDFRLLQEVPALLADAAGTGQRVGYQLTLSPYRPDSATLRATARHVLELEDRQAPSWLTQRSREADSRLRSATWALEERFGAQDEATAHWLARALADRHDRDLPGIEAPDFTARPDGEREALSMPAHALFFDRVESFDVLERAGFAERSETIAGLFDWQPPYRLSRPEMAGPVSPHPEPPPDPGAAIKDVGAYDGNDPYLFISYRHADRQRVVPVLDALNAGGLLYWIDTGLHAGDEWDTVLEERIRDCTAVMAMTSQSYVGSKYCRREVKYADVLNKPILPVLLEPVSLAEGLHMLFQQYQIFDASADSDFEPLIADILRLIRTAA